MAAETPITMDGHPITDLVHVRQPKTPEQEAALAELSGYEDRYDYHTVAMPGIGGAKSFPENKMERPVDMLALRFRAEMLEASRRGDSTELCCG